MFFVKNLHEDAVSIGFLPQTAGLSAGYHGVLHHDARAAIYLSNGKISTSASWEKQDSFVG